MLHASKVSIKCQEHNIMQKNDNKMLKMLVTQKPSIICSLILLPQTVNKMLLALPASL